MGYTKKKYSEIEEAQREWSYADQAMSALFRNGFAVMDWYNEIELQRLVKALKDLNVPHNIRFVPYVTQPPNVHDFSKGKYEFSLPQYFVDDRN